MVSVVIGLLVGFWLGFERLSGDVLEPMIVTLYAIPKLTLYPILLLAFGLGLSAKVAFGVLHGVIPIILFTLNVELALITLVLVIPLLTSVFPTAACLRQLGRWVNRYCTATARKWLWFSNPAEGVTMPWRSESGSLPNAT